MRATFKLTMVDAMSLKNIRVLSINLAQEFRTVTLQQKTALLAVYRGTLFLDVIQLAADTQTMFSSTVFAAKFSAQVDATKTDLAPWALQTHSKLLS